MVALAAIRHVVVVFSSLFFLISDCSWAGGGF